MDDQSPTRHGVNARRQFNHHHFKLSSLAVGDDITQTFSQKMSILHVQGDLLDQDVEVIVNAWNRNLIPWWLLLPQGISGAIKKRGGLAPFKELRKFGVLPLGGAAVTGAGRLPFKAIIHVAGIGHCWRSSEASIRGSVRSAISKAEEHGFESLGFPLIGAGTGGGSPDKVEGMIREEIERSGYTGRAVIVRYTKKTREQAGTSNGG